MRVSLAIGAMAIGASTSAWAGDAPVAVPAIQIHEFRTATRAIGEPLRRELRLRVALAPQALPLIGDLERIQPRVARAMFDFYPHGGLGGFHLSAGLHYYSRYNANYEAQKATDGKLFIPRGRTGGGVRTGFNRYTPAVTAGYAQPLGGSATLGLEGGALVGRAYNARPFRNLADMGERRAGLNPVANLVLGVRF